MSGMKIFGTAQAKALNSNINTDFEAAQTAYENDGYLIYDFSFSDQLLSEAAEITASIGISAPVLDLLGRLYGRRPFPFQTLNFRVGTQQATHADSIHFASLPENFMCGVWVALEDIDMDNGPLHYFRGSHKRPNATMDDVEASAQGDVNRFFKEAAAPYEKDFGLIKRGQAVIWAANLLHGGDPIADKTRSRLSQVTHYFFDECCYVTPLHSTTGGRAYVRHPYDFSTNKFIWGRKNGKIVRPHIKSFLGGYLKNIKRKTYSF